MHASPNLRTLLALCATALLVTTAQAVEPLPVFDAHLHYNIEARESIRPPKCWKFSGRAMCAASSRHRGRTRVLRC